MKKIDGLMVAKIGGIVLSVAAAIVSALVSTKENERTLQKLVDDKFNN